MRQPPMTSTPLFLERRQVPGTCPQCGGEALQSYPVHSEGGWFDVVKCQACLHSVSRDRGHRLGPVRLLSDTL